MIKLIGVIILCATLEGITKCVYAGALCYPYEATASSPQVVSSDDGKCLVWFCDVGHQWKTVYICGTTADINPMLLENFLRWSTADKATKDAAFDAIPETAPAGSADARLMTLAQSVAKPSQPPPSGLVTIKFEAYKQTQGINGFTWKKFGTVPLGTPCYSTASDGSKVYKKVDGYYLIDRSLVTKTVKFDLLPNAAYGVCE